MTSFYALCRLVGRLLRITNDACSVVGSTNMFVHVIKRFPVQNTCNLCAKRAIYMQNACSVYLASHGHYLHVRTSLPCRSVFMGD